jgi:hypothetical protein
VQAPQRSKGKNAVKAVAVVLSVLVIVSMLFGWLYFGVNVPMDEFPDELWGIIPHEIGFSMTMFDLANFVGMADNILQGIANEIMIALGPMAYELMEINDWLSILQPVSTVLTIVMILMIVSFVLIIVFIFLVVLENKHGAIFGQLGLILAFIISAVFAAFMLLINSFLPYDATAFVSFGSSIWVYLAVVYSLAAFILVTARRKAIRGL